MHPRPVPSKRRRNWESQDVDGPLFSLVWLTNFGDGTLFLSFATSNINWLCLCPD
jgi:hypothetical protein